MLPSCTVQSNTMNNPSQFWLTSVEKWELYWVSVHNTVSTASASDWFTASLALCRITGQLDSHSFAHDQFTSDPQQHNLWMTHFHLGVGREIRMKPEWMIHPCSLIICELCLGLPSQTGGCRFSSAVVIAPNGEKAVMVWGEGGGAL